MMVVGKEIDIEIIIVFILVRNIVCIVLNLMSNKDND